MIYISIISMTETQIYSFGVPIILALIASEVIYSSIYRLNYYTLKDSLAGLGLLAGNFIVGLLTKGSIFLAYVYLYQFRIITIDEILPNWVVWLLTFIIVDFVYYWYHRCSHRVRFFWAVHMNHHSSEEMNFSVSLRQAWFGGINKFPFFMIIPLIGFNPIITAIASLILMLWGVTGHTKWIKKLGLLEYIFVTPSHHRVHHGSNEEYIDKNYGNFLIIWDRMFGTFKEEKNDVVYGIRENVKTFNPVKITFLFWKNMITDYKKSKNFRDKFLSLFGSPEWKP